VLAVISKGMQIVKLHFNSIMWFLADGFWLTQIVLSNDYYTHVQPLCRTQVPHNGCKIIVVVTSIFYYACFCVLEHEDYLLLSVESVSMLCLSVCVCVRVCVSG